MLQCHEGKELSWTYRNRLHSRFSASEETSVPDDFFVALREVSDHEVSAKRQLPPCVSDGMMNLRKHIVELEAQHLENKPSKGLAEARVDPVIRRLALLEFSCDYDAPKPPSSLRDHDEAKGPAASGLQGELLVVQE